ncbi:hypothetical protein T265_03859 [Opisthorchis viverrini]|uniref:Uncharacterized protein n=1 Tax=Opisthorchis viverrini TaxID=6198 RepID=A0A074ZR13_OPIVI|nr:hypothetical protein T265_03859 [Opisthorchis viverrini]KER29561.1 hypothetical protein T265_03859 [Opisthorchis viverrini]
MTRQSPKNCVDYTESPYPAGKLEINASDGTGLPLTILSTNGKINKENERVSKSSCKTLPVLSCHFTRMKHEGWAAARLPKPRRGKLRCRTMVRTKDLPVIRSLTTEECG